MDSHLARPGVSDEEMMGEGTRLAPCLLASAAQQSGCGGGFYLYFETHLHLWSFLWLVELSLPSDTEGNSEFYLNLLPILPSPKIFNQIPKADRPVQGYPIVPLQKLRLRDQK